MGAAAVVNVLTCLWAGGGQEGGRGLPMVRQLVGNNDEVTDLRFVGPPATPTHLAVATNSPAIRLFDTEALGAPAPQPPPLPPPCLLPAVSL